VVSLATGRHTARHWKDFFVQIAAIAIGLLLALGLDRIGGYFHERRQLAQARRGPNMEIQQNRQIWKENLEEVRIPWARPMKRS
jgi:hypothetical protein